ncbi:hypothetical protein KIN20_031229 [Parelaphostrongylus tenuis]|uniref:Uncharacterized protein n=1 Tax=Parelaphostrongylus tenuis TaxID=148309 RepID=A0AAD5R4V4_PARTN|nr:hypothetical protein KIN20_031229 [Parelaphostrongylus tenuis]
MVYHTFTCIAYLTPIAGSILADSYIGRFKEDVNGVAIPRQWFFDEHAIQSCPKQSIELQLLWKALQL